MKPDGGTAFPQGQVFVSGNQQTFDHGPRGGMTLRDYFAASAIQGMLADPNIHNMDNFCKSGPKQAYAVADAMLEERSK